MHYFNLILKTKYEKSKNCVIGAEIGVYNGANAVNILSNENIKLYMIDPYLKYEEYENSEKGSSEMSRSVESWNQLFVDIYNKFNNTYKNRVFFIRCKSEFAHNYFPDFYFDFVYIDGNHLYDYVKKDIYFYYPKTKNGGLFGGHNYETAHPGVIKAVDEFIESTELELNVKGNCWWITKP